MERTNTDITACEQNVLLELCFIVVVIGVALIVSGLQELIVLF